MLKIVKVILFTFIIVSFTSCSKNTTLNVTSNPIGSTILLDGKEIGKTPYKGQIAKGEHKFSSEQTRLLSHISAVIN